MSRNSPPEYTSAARLVHFDSVPSLVHDAYCTYKEPPPEMDKKSRGDVFLQTQCGELAVVQIVEWRKDVELEIAMREELVHQLIKFGSTECVLMLKVSSATAQKLGDAEKLKLKDASPSVALFHFRPSGKQVYLASEEVPDCYLAKLIDPKAFMPTLSEVFHYSLPTWASLVSSRIWATPGKYNKMTITGSKE